MKPSLIVITMLVFIGGLIMVSNIISNFTSETVYDYSVNESKYNRTFSKFDNLTNDLIDNQGILRNETLRKDENELFSNDNIVTISVRAINSLFKSGDTASAILTDVQESANLPFNVYSLLFGILLSVLIFGIVSWFMRKDG